MQARAHANPAPGPKFDYKLRWFGRLTAHAHELLARDSPVAGDYNVIPSALDAAHPNRWVRDALFFPESRAAYQGGHRGGATAGFHSTCPPSRATIDGMNRRRRFLFLFLAAIVVGMAVGVWAMWPRPSAITRENASTVREGMTLADVEAILGGPARDESTGLLAPDNRDGTSSTIWMWAQPPPRAWISDCVAVHVRFDNAGLAQAVWCIPLRRIEECTLDRLRRWLRL